MDKVDAAILEHFIDLYGLTNVVNEVATICYLKADKPDEEHPALWMNGGRILDTITARVARELYRRA
jgi:hypothetical protein